MKRIVGFFLLLLPMSLPAQRFRLPFDFSIPSISSEKPKSVKFDWNVNFDYLFNNSEFAYSKNLVQPSGTVNAMRLTPYAGVLIKSRPNVHHRLMAGLDIRKNFGAGEQFKDLFEELQLFYRVDAVFSNGGLFKAAAGCFPQSWRMNMESGPFWDDTRMFFDPNMEGLLFQYDSGAVSAELGIDWMGQFGDAEHPRRRERFEIFTGGEWKFSSPLSLYWSGSFYHFASCPEFLGVVDNDLLELSLDIHPDTWFDIFKVRIGALASYQWDRAFTDSPVFPVGLYSRWKFEKCHFGFENEFYWGKDLMPFYFSSNGGVMYGDDLYKGMKCFRTMSGHPAICDNATLYYSRQLAEYVNVGVKFRFQLGSACGDIPVFRGWQQIISLNLNLACLASAPSRKHKPLFSYESL